MVLTVTFAPGENEAFVPVPTRSDSIVEGTEQFVVLLMTVSPRVDLGAASRATVDITELPPERKLLIPNLLFEKWLDVLHFCLEDSSSFMIYNRAMYSIM